MSTEGQIAKLVVNIDQCQTRITYQDGSTRLLFANPSGFSFHGIDANTSAYNESPGNGQNDASAFLEHHFDAENKFRFPLNYDYRNEVDIIWYPCYTEANEFPTLQKAEIIEWPWPKEESLQIFHRFWHLDNCASRKLAITNEFQKPRCYCLQIKETMDRINELVSPEASETESDKATLSTDLNTKMMSVNGFLKELNELLESQENRNKRHQNRLAKKRRLTK